MPARPASSLLAVAAVTVAVLAATPAAAQSPAAQSPAAQSPAAQSPAASPIAGASQLPAATPFPSTAISAVPTPGAIVDPQPVPWQHVTISPDGVSLTVTFANGAEACFGLDRVEVTEGEDGILTVTPFVGFREDAANVRCIAVMESYQTTITLDAPLLGGGVPGILGPIDYPADNAIIAPSGPLAAVEPQAWEAVQLGPDGATGFVAFTTGNPSCFGFDHVGGAMDGDLLVLSVFTGPVAGGPQVCTMEAYLVQAPFTLEMPILLGGGAAVG